MLCDADSDPFRECKTKDEVIACYSQHLNEIRAFAEQKYGIGTKNFAEIFRSEFIAKQQYESNTTPHSFSSTQCKQNGRTIRHFSVLNFNAHSILKDVCRQLKRYSSCIALLAILLILVNHRTELTQLFMRNIQVYIYPGMRIWRKLTLPIIQQFPELTELYDETCLVSNPMFRVTNLDCTPCIDVINVVDLSQTPNFSYLGNNIPHIIRQADGVNQTIAKIHQLYQRNRRIFRDEAYKIRSTHSNIANLDQLFAAMLNSSGKEAQRPSHNLWRINRMTPARLLRTVFPTPKTIPIHAGIDIERYIAFDIDGGVTYQLPSTDCSNMFVYQAIGSRLIHLQPTTECKHHCRRLTVKLKQNHTLFYDWWYWKPVSSAGDRPFKRISVSYIGSYC